jgi:hypothetical protein
MPMACGCEICVRTCDDLWMFHLVMNFGCVDANVVYESCVWILCMNKYVLWMYLIL